MLWELWESSESASEKTSFHGNQPREARAPLPSPLSIRAMADSDHNILTDSLKVPGTLQCCRDSASMSWG